MKKLTALKFALCACVAVALTSGGLFAFAEENSTSQTVYPEEFQSHVLTDYAVCGDSFAYAAENKIAVYRGDDKPVYYEKEGVIDALDCYNEAFVYMTGDKVYNLSDDEEVDYVITPTELPVATGGYSYTIKPDNTIKTTDRDGNDGVVEGDFSNLKVYGNTVYAINGNVLNKIIPPETAEPLPYKFDNYSAADKIAVGTAVQDLQNFNLENPHSVTLRDGEYLTKVYLDGTRFNINQITATDFFTVGKTFKVGEENGFNDGQAAILLCTTGNADIITVNGDCYLKLHFDGTVTEIALDEPDFSVATFNVPPYDYVYSSRPVSLNAG